MNIEKHSHCAMDAAQVRIHLRASGKPSGGKGKNAGYIVYVIMYTSHQEYSIWKRTLRHKGINPNEIATRDMNADERTITERSWRLLFYAYRSWEQLLEDEWIMTKNKVWMQKLITLSRQKISLEKIQRTVGKRPGPQCELFETLGDAPETKKRTNRMKQKSTQQSPPAQKQLVLFE